MTSGLSRNLPALIPEGARWKDKSVSMSGLSSPRRGTHSDLSIWVLIDIQRLGLKVLFVPHSFSEHLLLVIVIFNQIWTGFPCTSSKSSYMCVAVLHIAFNLSHASGSSYLLPRFLRLSVSQVLTFKPEVWVLASLWLLLPRHLPVPAGRRNFMSGNSVFKSIGSASCG